MTGRIQRTPLLLRLRYFLYFINLLRTNAGIANSDSTAYLGYAVAFATFIIAMIGPILGALADYQGLKKKFFFTFFAIGSLSTASLAFVPEGNGTLFISFLCDNSGWFSRSKYILRCIFSRCDAGEKDGRSISSRLWSWVYREYNPIHY